ncbi:MAG: hypothetical protein AAF654_07200 [Myxococcota bacterium]
MRSSNLVLSVVSLVLASCGSSNLDGADESMNGDIGTGLLGWYHIPFDDLGLALTYSFAIDSSGVFVVEDGCDYVGSLRPVVKEQTEERIVVESFQFLTEGDAVFELKNGAVVLSDSVEGGVEYTLEEGRLCGVVRPNGFACVGAELCEVQTLP